jgi:hypothetical protein
MGQVQNVAVVSRRLLVPSDVVLEDRPWRRKKFMSLALRALALRCSSIIIVTSHEELNFPELKSGDMYI